MSPQKKIVGESIKLFLFTFYSQLPDLPGALCSLAFQVVAEAHERIVQEAL